MRITVLEPLGISEQYMNSLIAPFKEKGHEVVVYENRIDEKEELKKRASGAQVLVLANMPVPREVFSSDESLKMVSVAFTGVDHIDMAYCREKGVMVCNAAGYSTNSVAELAFGLMISVLRNIVPIDNGTRNGKTKAGFSQHELYGKTIGIIGTGAIGLKVAEIAKAFGCNVIAYSRTVKKEAEALGVRYVSLDELMRDSDIVTIHTPLNNETKGLIDSGKIALMKPGAVLINTARGPIVDYQALAEALKKGDIAGAGIDVFENEPPIEGSHPLFKAPHVVVTPHIGFATAEAINRRAQITFDNISKWMEGKPQNIVK